MMKSGVNQCCVERKHIAELSRVDRQFAGAERLEMRTASEMRSEQELESVLRQKAADATAT